MTSERLLLDTHVVLWAMNEPHRLSETVRVALADRGSLLLVSAATAWEISFKIRARKLAVDPNVLLTFSAAVGRLGAEEVPMTSTHGLLAGALEWSHRDPFDRLLAAQAMLESAALVTADAAFAGLPGLSVYW